MGRVCRSYCSVPDKAHGEHTAFGELVVEAVTEISLVAPDLVQVSHRENMTTVLAEIVEMSILLQAEPGLLLEMWLFWSWILIRSNLRHAGLGLLLVTWPFWSWILEMSIHHQAELALPLAIWPFSN